MTAIAVTSAWSDPSASLTADQVYIVQNQAEDFVQFFEATAFDADTAGGILLAPMGSVGNAPNFMRWTYISTNEVRLRVVGPGTPGVVEFALGS